jgi:hypothetical protein
MGSLLKAIFIKVRDLRARWIFLLALVLPAVIFVPWALFGDSVPRFWMSLARPRFLAGLVVLEAGLVSIGVWRWWRATGLEADRWKARRRGLWVLLASGLGVGLISGAVFLVYGSWYSEARQICEVGLGAPTLKERERALDAAKPWLEKVAFFNENVFSCEELTRELGALNSQGACPRFPPEDVRCTCGAQRWPEDWTKREATKCDRDYKENGYPLRLMSRNK